MARIKSLFKDTAVYGTSSIIGKFLNWWLVPLYTRVFADGEYGIVTYIYSFVALGMVILTYGLETGYFRFSKDENGRHTYSTAIISLACSSALFLAVLLPLSHVISGWEGFGGHPSYIMIMGVCMAIDTVIAIPFCSLRNHNRPVRFAVLKFINIGLNIGLNLFFLLVCPWLMKVAPSTVNWWYSPAYGIGYIFLANLIASAATLLMLFPELRGFEWRFDKALWRRMIAYCFPLMLMGIAGIMNQTIDKILFPTLYKGPDAMAQLGIYGANYKIGIVMLMFCQAFRFAFDPFIFSKDKGADEQERRRTIAMSLKYFVIAELIVFLGVMFYLDIVRLFIAPSYYSGLKVVPIIMLAEMFFGVYYILSAWCKLIDRTIWATYFSVAGLAVTLLLNVALVPQYGYMGCAWAAFFCYGLMMVASYIVGQGKMPIAYPMKRISLYAALAAALYALGMYAFDFSSNALNIGLRTVLLIAFVAVVLKAERISPRSVIKSLKRR